MVTIVDTVHRQMPFLVERAKELALRKREDTFDRLKRLPADHRRRLAMEESIRFNKAYNKAHNKADNISVRKYKKEHPLSGMRGLRPRKVKITLPELTSLKSFEQVMGSDSARANRS